MMHVLGRTIPTFLQYKYFNLRVGHEQPRIFTTWQLDAVHIEIPSHKESFTFPADRQIGGYGTLDVDLYPENAGIVFYSIWIIYRFDPFHPIFPSNCHGYS